MLSISQSLESGAGGVLSLLVIRAGLGAIELSQVKRTGTSPLPHQSLVLSLLVIRAGLEAGEARVRGHMHNNDSNSNAPHRTAGNWR